MALLEADTTPTADPTPSPAPALADPAPSAVLPDDPMADAASKLFDNGNPPPAAPSVETPKPDGERDPALPPEGETPEAKAAREAAETPEQKTAREAAEAKAQRYGAPEAYEFAAPEGVELDTELTAELSVVAKELDLSPASAQRIVDLAVKMQQKNAAAADAQLDAIHTGWQTAAKTDKEFGGDKLNESLGIAQRALKQFGSPELNELIGGAKLGDHPEVIRLLYRVGKAVSEAPIVHSTKPGSASAASVMYPNMKQKD